MSSCWGVGLRRVSSYRPIAGSPEISWSFRFRFGAVVGAAIIFFIIKKKFE
jgi:hypothetical protein